MILYSVCLIYTLSEFVESRWLSKVLLWLKWLYIIMLANVENQLDARSSGLSIFWWVIFILVDLICWWVIFILVGYLCSGGLYIYILVGYVYFSGPSVFWWANFMLFFLCLFYF